MELICPICNVTYTKSTGHYNRAIKLGANLYCSKKCSSIGRKLQSDKHLKTTEQLKAEKSEYDKKRRKGEKREEILEKKKAYHAANRDKILPKQRAYNKSRMSQHVIYCRQPEQREKERIRNRKKSGSLELKTCLLCNKEKQKFDFEAYKVFTGGRLYLCRECEETQEITMREVLGNIRTALIKSKSNLKVSDICTYPYLIESHKYLLLLKRLTK